MFFLPYEKIVYRTALSSDDIEHALSINTEPSRIRLAFLEGKSPNTFEGEVDNSSFVIRRIKYSNNSFNPVVRGKAVEYESHTKVVILLIPTVFTTLYFLICVGMVMFAVFGDVMDAITYHAKPHLIFLFPLLLYTIILILFKLDSRKVKDALQSTLQLK